IIPTPLRRTVVTHTFPSASKAKPSTSPPTPSPSGPTISLSVRLPSGCTRKRMMLAFMVSTTYRYSSVAWCQQLPPLIDKGRQKLFLPPSDRPAHQRSCQIPVCYDSRCCPTDA